MTLSITATQHINALLYAVCLYAEYHFLVYRYAERHYAECHYAECRYAECRYSGCCGVRKRIPVNSSANYQVHQSQMYLR